MVKGNASIIKRSDFCSHNFIRVTKSTTLPPPYDKCSKCGAVTNPSTCRIGSCQRHGKCMYFKCRNV